MILARVIRTRLELLIFVRENLEFLLFFCHIRRTSREFLEVV
jgi:hypothetical protein